MAALTTIGKEILRLKRESMKSHNHFHKFCEKVECLNYFDEIKDV